MTPPISPSGQGGTGRFAPSPTGGLHVGHLYSALMARDRTWQGHGRFLIRIEDLDESRCRPEFVGALIADLAWAGIESDGPIIRQSNRLTLYEKALSRLRAMDLIYPCTCTRGQVAADALNAPHGAGPIYGGRCRERRPWADGEPADGQPFVWRLDTIRAQTGLKPLCFIDAWTGRHPVDNAALAAFGDVVLARKDGRPAYHLAVVVDDAEQAVSEVVRGRDLLGATAIHRLLQALLDLPTPRYAHHPLVIGADGKRLAKRDRPATLSDLRASGTDPEHLVRQLRAGILPSPYRFDRYRFDR